MLKRALLVGALCSQLVCMAVAQNGCATTGQAQLYCLIPTALHTPAGEFSFFNTSFATSLAQLPLATPASGIVFEYDSHGVLTVSNKDFGPIMTERAETIGKHKLFVEFTYQHFSFRNIDGNSLQDVPIVLHTADDSVFTQTTNHIATAVNQYAIFGTFGLTSRIDVSIAIPIERVSLGMSTSGTEFSTTSNATKSFQEYIPGEASGFGDVVLGAKGTAWYGKHMALAFGAELRLPSGDATNFLGSGAVGVKPYATLSGNGRISPHANLGYQWNGNSVLNTNSAGQEQQLPTYFLYYFGVDAAATKRVTVVADYLGQEFFNAPRVTTPSPQTIPNRGLSFPSIEPYTGSYNASNVALGVKLNLWKQLLITGNMLIRVNDGGLHANITPLIGISYSH
jgi:Putative MetA-pathway of phenol degradation